MFACTLPFSSIFFVAGDEETGNEESDEEGTPKHNSSFALLCSVALGLRHKHDDICFVPCVEHMLLDSCNGMKIDHAVRP